MVFVLTYKATLINSVIPRALWRSGSRVLDRGDRRPALTWKIDMTLSYDSFVADFFDTASIALSSLEEHEEVVASHDVNLRMLQTGKGAFRSVFASRSCGETELHSGGFNAALTMEMESPVDAVMFIFPRSASGRFLANGIDLGDDKLIFVPPGTGIDIVVPALAGSHSVSIPPRRFHELIQRLCPSLGPPECLTVVGSNPVRSRQLHADITTLIGQSGSSVGGEDLSNLLAVLIAALESDAGGEAPDCLLTATNPRVIMQNSNHPAAEWNPPSAISGDTQVPTPINAAIRKLFAIQIRAMPIGKRSSAFGKRNDLRKANK